MGEVITTLFELEEKKYRNLADRWIEPPFSIIDMSSKRWRDGSKKWLNSDTDSGRGNAIKQRGIGLTGQYEYGNNFSCETISPMARYSKFSPRLCELIYNWYCPDGGSILDPFAGGAVRGFVASKLGYNYTGIDIRKEAIEENIYHVNSNSCKYICGDSNETLDTITQQFDIVISCPPYYDTEVYSDIDGDISNMNYAMFSSIYKRIMTKAFSKVRMGGYGCVIIGDVRDKNGFMLPFEALTTEAAKDSGMGMNDKIILRKPIGNKMLLTNRHMNNRKVTRIHEYLLVYKKKNI